MTHTMSTTATTHGAERKPARLAGMTPAPDVASYDAVPWYRKQWFALFPLFAPVLVIVALTGDVYARSTELMRDHSDAEVWRYSVASRAFFVAVALFVTASAAYNLWG